MASQPSILDPLAFQLVPTNAAPPSFKYPAASTEEGSHDGCSICPSVAYFGDAPDSRIALTILLPTNLAAPERLEFQVIVGNDPRMRFAPTPESIALLVSSRRERWTFPAGATRPTTLTISYGFWWNGQMVSEIHAVSPSASGDVIQSAS